jgi:FAD synthetase
MLSIMPGITKNSDSKNVFVWGTFDLIHEGHMNFLTKAKKLGKLHVVIIPSLRKTEKKLFHTDQQRLQNLLNTGTVDKVFIDSYPDGMKCFTRTKPDVFALGYDQKTEWETLLTDLLKIHYPDCEVVRLRRSGNIHSSILKKSVKCHCGSGKKWKNCHGSK